MTALKRFLCVFSCIMILTAALLPVSALADYEAVLTRSTKVYAKLSKDSASVRLKKGTKVTVKETANGVAKISYNGVTGYMKKSALSAVSETSSAQASASGTSTRVAVSGARAYKSASTSSDSVSVKKGTKVTVIGTDGSWAKVQKSGYTAWMKKSALELYGGSEEESEAAESSGAAAISNGTKAQKVIALAKSKRGCKYVYGSTGPNTFDCGGFVKYCYKQVGVSVGSSAKGIGYGSSKIGYSELQPGDIVCFDTVSDDGDLSDHVGIYIGSGKFVHASSAAGKVITSSLSSGYYKKVFSWGRRVL